MKGFKNLDFGDKIFSCEVSAMRTNHVVEHDGNSVLEGFRNCYATLAENLVKMLAKPPNQYSINTVIGCYERMIEDDCFNLACVSKKSILTILNVTQVSKAAGCSEQSIWAFSEGSNF